jgi:hypothetical protein
MYCDSALNGGGDTKSSKRPLTRPRAGVDPPVTDDEAEVTATELVELNIPGGSAYPTPLKCAPLLNEPKASFLEPGGVGEPSRVVGIFSSTTKDVD